MDIITIIWYLSTFLALAAFFFLMACSDRKCGRTRIQNEQNIIQAPPTPAPSYSEFAPPSYESVIKQSNFFNNNNNNQHHHIYVIPINNSSSNNNNNQQQKSITENCDNKDKNHNEISSSIIKITRIPTITTSIIDNSVNTFNNTSSNINSNPQTTTTVPPNLTVNVAFHTINELEKSTR